MEDVTPRRLQTSSRQAGMVIGTGASRGVIRELLPRLTRWWYRLVLQTLCRARDDRKGYTRNKHRGRLAVAPLDESPGLYAGSALARALAPLPGAAPAWVGAPGSLAGILILAWGAR